MRLRFSLKYMIAFIALNFIMGELHEQAHINTGYFLCGCYGPRNFDVWSICGQCTDSSLAYLATLAGPLFSCTLMWLGALWFSGSGNIHRRMIGFSLLFANLPFARIFTALTGGGDEKIVVQSLIHDNSNSVSSKIVASVIVLMVCLPPIMMVARKMINKNRWAIVAGFCIIPLIYGMFYQRLFLNSLFDRGILATVNFLGTPDIILLHFVLMLFLLFLFRKNLLKINYHPALNL